MTALANRIGSLQGSPVREILSLIEQPGMVSFAGGLPAQSTFPEFDTRAMPASYLQYGCSEGEPELRELISRDMTRLGLNCSPAQVLILSGSQQGIDLCSKLYVDEDSCVAVETPSYLAALQVFRLFGATFQPLNPESPASLLARASKPKLIYTIPSFRNPNGYCYSGEERARLAQVCVEGNIPLFEDDPYRDLAYEDCERTPVCSALKSGSWIYQGSFSKILAPGLRLGFLVCSEDLITPLVRLKQAADLHSNRVSQWFVIQQLKDPQCQLRIKNLTQHYRRKRDIFAGLLKQYLADLASWQLPKGGLFFWLKLNADIDTEALLLRAIKQNVAFMPGEHFFYASNVKGSFLRLNFSHASEEDAERGLKTLANLIAKEPVSGTALDLSSPEY